MKVIVNNEALAAVLGVQPGAEIDVKCKHDIPVDKEWRNRFSDSLIDDCISVVPVNKPKPKQTPSVKGES